MTDAALLADAADRFGTPLYVTDLDRAAAGARAWRDALPGALDPGRCREHRVADRAGRQGNLAAVDQADDACIDVDARDLGVRVRLVA